ncbi:MAG: hypothetical protein ACO3N7_02345 [Kiritimatiellia bacterium]
MDFVRIASFPNQLEAETAAHLLDAEEIPYTIHNDGTLFGEGGLVQNVFLSVPELKRDLALSLIDRALGAPEEI